MVFVFSMFFQTKLLLVMIHSNLLLFGFITTFLVDEPFDSILYFVITHVILCLGDQIPLDCRIWC